MLPLPRFEIRKTKRPLMKQRYHVVLIAENGETLSTSEKLSSDAAAMSNVESQMANAGSAEVIRV